MMILDSQGGVHLVDNGMSNTLPNLADLPPDVRAYIAAQTAELVAERIAHSLVVQYRDTIIADLRLQLDGHKKHRFGSRSESLDQLALELMLEEHEIAQASEAGEGATPASEEVKPTRTPRERKPFPKDLERVETRITPSDACTDCGGSFKDLGTDVMEELEYVPGHYIVNQIIRPRLACTCCEAVVQAPMPSRPIPKSFVGPALMAHILASKYGYHLPLYRQSQMFENAGIELSGSLLASWVGKSTKLLERVSYQRPEYLTHLFGFKFW